MSPFARHVIHIQEEIISKSNLEEDRGSARNVRDPGVFGSIDFFLEYEARFETFGDAVYRAAWILHALATRHPFQNGNKRTAFTVADTLLRVECGCKIGSLQREKAAFIIAVASYLHDVADVESWIRENLEETE
ncbi:Fic family protein [Methanoculleus frigidifontis]|uniref:Fic family protein n=1 Tax=Methanoculleus frigidifontis TaxID=2584085 RepID=UPI00265A86BA|nr:Fic family protein [Methanoculleus sp. FWC-SCC1]